MLFRTKVSTSKLKEHKIQADLFNSLLTYLICNESNLEPGTAQCFTRTESQQKEDDHHCRDLGKKWKPHSHFPLEYIFLPKYDTEDTLPQCPGGWIPSDL